MLPDDMLLRYDPAESMLDHDRRKRIEALLAENAALRERLAAAEQRERDARAIIEPIATSEAQEHGDVQREVGLFHGAWNVLWVHDQARAWLADRAGQRAASQEVPVEKREHSHKVGDHVTLTNGQEAEVLSLWYEDDGTPGYGVRVLGTGDYTDHTAIHDVHIKADATTTEQEAGDATS